MTFTCLNCGSTATNARELCNPSNDELVGTFCGTSTDKVCEEKVSSMEYRCDACGGLSPDAEHLCNPRKIH